MPISVSGRFIQESPNAVQIAIEGDPDRMKWIPRSVVDEGLDEALDEGDDVNLLIKTWWAKQEGLDE